MSTVRDLQDVVRRIKEATFRDFRVALPARVERYDAAKCLVDVQPLLRELMEAEDGSLSNLRPQPVTNVPVHFPGAGGYRITFPVQVGDLGYVLFADRSLDRWLSGRGEEVDLDDERAHDLSDGIAFEPGVRPFGSPWTGASTTRATIGKDGGLQISFGAADIEVGGADAAIARADKVEQHLETIRAVINAIVSGAIPAPLVGVGSATVKVKG